jgi:hypothetical protein
MVAATWCQVPVSITPAAELTTLLCVPFTLWNWTAPLLVTHNA